MPPAHSDNFHCLSADEAAALILGAADATLFDSRDLASYRQGHIDGAIHLTEQRLPVWFGRLAKDAPLIIYCYHGNASKTFAAIFADFHFTRVYSVDGGYAPLAAAVAARTGRSGDVLLPQPA